MNEETDDDVDDLDDDYNCGDFAPLEYIRRLPKCQRAPRFEKDVLTVEHVENSQLIYLQYPWQCEKRAHLDNLLYSQWSTFARLPAEFRVADQLVAIRNPRKGGMVCRAVIIDWNSLLLVDYGRFVKCPDQADLRLLPADGAFAEEPMTPLRGKIFIDGGHVASLNDSMVFQ
uniref:Tudor domain-containing protein n=1 Tax=Caenorhabditis japonica TaxID=281687 RepID=A0A8R1DQR4_CAEJA